MQLLSLDSQTARLEIRILLGHALGVDRTWLIAHEHDFLMPEAVARYESLLDRRLAGEPIAYILGEKEFHGRTFRVTPDVLIPRPETELLVELALAQCRTVASPRILDLGTGSGCIAITLALECPSASVSAVEHSPSALVIARQNADRHQADIRFFQGDWFEPVAGQRFDIIVANPPYIAPDDPHLLQGDVRYEPLSALVAENRGMSALQTIAIQAKAHLHPNGWLFLEHGYNQSEDMKAVLMAAGYPCPRYWLDGAGITRVSGARLSE